MIRLDWDNIGRKTCKERIDSIKGSKYVQSIEVRASPSLDGYHVIVNTFYAIPRGVEHFLRKEWWDDLNRLVMDMLSYTRARNVLFQSKIINGIELNEIPLYLYYRHKQNSKWLVENLRKKKE